MLIDKYEYTYATEYLRNEQLESLHVEEKEQSYVHAEYNVYGSKKACDLVFLNKELIKYTCNCILSKDRKCRHVHGAEILYNRLYNGESFDYVSHKKETIDERVNEIIRKRKLAELLEKTQSSRSILAKNKEIYQSRLISSMTDEQYKLQPVVHDNHGGIEISYKVGLDKFYVVQSIDTFLDRIKNNEYGKYGKIFGFTHQIDAFDKKSQQHIDFMKYCQEQALNDRYSYYGYNPRLGKSIPLEDSNLDMFYDICMDESYDYIHTYEINNKMKIHINRLDDVYELKLHFIGSYYKGNKHLYELKLDKKQFDFGRLTLDDGGIVVELLNQFELDDEIYILKDEYKEFYKYILLPIADYVEIIDHTQENYNQFDIAKIYGDIIDQDTLEFKLIYSDENNNQAYGFDNQNITTYNQDIIENYILKYCDHISDKHSAIFNLKSEKTYQFIYEGLEFLKDYAQIFVSEQLKNIGKKMHYTIKMGVGIKKDLLSFDISSEELPMNEIRDILSQYRQKKKFYRLKSGDVISLDSPELEELNNFIDEYHIDSKQLKKGHFDMSKQRMLSIDHEMDDFKYLQTNRAESFNKQLEKYDQAYNELKIPVPYQNLLRNYQKEGVMWLHQLSQFDFNGILADDMGLGKTLQVITLLDTNRSNKPSIVVCPTSLVYNWADEIEKFAPELKYTCITGNQIERKNLIEQINDGIYITSYDSLKRDIELFDAKDFNYIIIDEAQYIKNHNTKNAQSVKKLTGNHRIALTGTPIENSLAELWSIFDFLMPDYLFNYHYFRQQYENDIIKNNDEEKINQLKKLVSPFILRRNKKEVLTELPEKIEQNIILPFNDEEKKLYIANLAKVNESVRDIYQLEGDNKLQILAMLTKLRQLCLEPRLLYDNIKQSSSKMKACLELLDNYRLNNQKVLLFSSFTTVLDYIAEECEKYGISYYMLTGSTSKERRRELVSMYQEDDTTVFLISLKAGGTGLNLTSAEAVIHYDPWWNIAMQNQATDRAYRIGQKNTVQVFNLIMKNSIEEKIIELQQSKKELFDTFVENNSGSFSSLSKEDIMQLLSM